MFDPEVSGAVREPSLRTGWVLSLCPAAAEGGGCFVSARRRAAGGGGVPDRERSKVEAARRARGRLRRYCVANRLNRLGTLTYAPPFCTDPAQVRADLGVFFRQLRSGLGGRVFPYAWAPEWHHDGVRLHAHFAVGRYIKWRLIRDTWGHGFVSIKLLSDLPVGSGTREEARRAAGYLAKYVTKAFVDESIARRHRYDVAQGFQPERVQVWGSSRVDVLDRASDMLGSGAPVQVWVSEQVPKWQGPPSLWAQWS